MLLTSQRVEESQAVLCVPWQSWTHQAANVSGAWADSGVSQQERSWLEDKAFIFFAKLSSSESARHQRSHHYLDLELILTSAVFNCFQPQIRFYSTEPRPHSQV